LVVTLGSFKSSAANSSKKASVMIAATCYTSLAANSFDLPDMLKLPSALLSFIEQPAVQQHNEKL
jgi:hypothetical protein